MQSIDIPEHTSSLVQRLDPGARLTLYRLFMRAAELGRAVIEDEKRSGDQPDLERRNEDGDTPSTPTPTA